MTPACRVGPWSLSGRRRGQLLGDLDRLVVLLALEVDVDQLGEGLLGLGLGATDAQFLDDRGLRVPPGVAQHVTKILAVGESLEAFSSHFHRGFGLAQIDECATELDVGPRVRIDDRSLAQTVQLSAVLQLSQESNHRVLLSRRAYLKT